MPWGVIASLVRFFPNRGTVLLCGFLLAYEFNFVALGCYEAVFLLASGLIFCGTWMISKVNEPRLREGNP